MLKKQTDMRSSTTNRRMTNKIPIGEREWLGEVLETSPELTATAGAFRTTRLLSTTQLGTVKTRRLPLRERVKKAQDRT